MGSEESNEMNEEKKTKKVTDAGDAPVTDEKLVEAESDQEPEVKAESQPETEQVEGEAEPQVVEAEAQPAADLAETDEMAIQEEVDESPFSEERIQRILDIELPVNISFGSTKRPLGEVLKLGPGALLELDRAADEPVILKVNNRVFAKGEIVDVDGYYGVQITEISSPAQRIASLGESA